MRLEPISLADLPTLRAGTIPDGWASPGTMILTLALPLP